MHPSSFPKKYGGELDWDWGDMPNLDDHARELIGALETPPEDPEGKPGFLKGPVLFKGDKIEVIGSEDGKPRREEIPVETKSKASTESTLVVEDQKTVENGDITPATPTAADAATAPVTNPLPGLEEDEKAALEKEIAEEAVSPPVAPTTA